MTMHSSSNWRRTAPV